MLSPQSRDNKEHRPHGYHGYHSIESRGDKRRFRAPAGLPCTQPPGLDSKWTPRRHLSEEGWHWEIPATL
jgi:hypothetical protein